MQDGTPSCTLSRYHERNSIMDLFDVLSLLGGLCLFLFSMNVMGDALESCHAVAAEMTDATYKAKYLKN